MEYFLQIFGDHSVAWAVGVIAAMIFLFGCYKKIENYFSEKAVRENEKDERIQKVINQAEQYPLWHQQSIDIREQFNKVIENINIKLDNINADLTKLKIENQENRATTCRYRILRFDDEIRHDQRHTKEHFDQILDDITDYELYCANHPDYKNNKAVMAIENIKEVYRECTQEGTFL